MIELFRKLAEFDDDIYGASDLDMRELDEMANVRGKSCKVDDIDFSFYFSRKNSNHAIRLKVLWNRERKHYSKMMGISSCTVSIAIMLLKTLNIYQSNGKSEGFNISVRSIKFFSPPYGK